MMAHAFFALAAAAGCVAIVGLALLRRRLVKHVELEVAEETLRKDFDESLEDSLR